MTENENIEKRLDRIETKLEKISQNTKPSGCMGSFDRTLLATILAGIILYQLGSSCIKRDMYKELRENPIPVYVTNQYGR